MDNQNIAVIEYSGVFPDAENEDVFFENLLNGRVAIKNLLNPEYSSKSDFDLGPHFSMDRSAPDMTYCRWASFLDRDILMKYALNNNLSLDQSTLSEIILHEISSRIFKRQDRTNLPSNIDLIIGTSTVDPTYIKCHQRMAVNEWVSEKLLEKPEFSCLRQYYYSTRLDKINSEPHSSQISFRFSLESLRDRFQLGGSIQIVEAACAASLAAMYVGINRLKSGLCNGVLVGSCGLDLNLFMMAGFSKIGVESTEITVPFSKAAAGMNPGEAAGLFLLLPELEAIKRKLPIKGLILSCEGSSDGALGGLVEPTEAGQIAVYQRAYEKLDNKDIDYLETHGTGTEVGDKTEISSIRNFFGEGLTIGGSKANIAHTMCAAGSVSLIKALKIIETKLIPPQPKNGDWMDLRGLKVVESEPLSIKNPINKSELRLGLSSFGFGGSNFHLVLGEYNPATKMNIKSFEKNDRIVLVGYHQVPMDLVSDYFKMSGHRIPPVTIPHLDKTIIGAIVATEQLFQKLEIRLSDEARAEVGVISTSDSILDVSRRWVEKEALLDVLRRLPDNDIATEIKKKIQSKLNSYPVLTEDSLPGALNNLISGKVTKAFDLRGPNFNLNDERASLGSAIESASSIIKNTGGAYIVTSVIEELRADGTKIDRNAVEVYFISELQFALKNNLPIKKELGKISRRRIDADKRRIYPNDPIPWG